MITTDLTQGRPVRLPVVYDRQEPKLEDSADFLLFDRLELRRYFPASVVDHLVKCAEPLEGTIAPAQVHVLESELFDRDLLERALRGDDWEEDARKPRLMRAAIGPDLPIIVATRMSLSFPILISAVPLWRLVMAADSPPAIQRVIFSDGGVTSNFPIHFFDSPLPRWPTFGLHLTSPGPREPMNLGDARACVNPPPAPGDPAAEPWREITDLKGFGAALKDAAQNWRDNAQARLPGFRDRIAHIKLDKGEGGLNLTMDTTVINHLNDRGMVAGTDLRELFSGAGDEPALTRHWDDHRFARYRVTMAVMQRLLQDYRRGYTTLAPGDDITTPYPQRLVQGEIVAPFEFRTRERLAAAKATSDAYVSLVDEPSEGLLDDENVPRPRATMRTVPPV
jgi:predicted acylesterase/phospholipase RssA